MPTPRSPAFAEYPTELMVAERKNVSAINAELAQAKDPSCLNPWITQVPWDVDQLNEHRLDGCRVIPRRAIQPKG